MALETSNADEAWQTIVRNAKQAKLLMQDAHSTLAGGSVTLEYVFDEIYQRVLNSRAQLENLKTTPGLAAYVKTVRDDLLYEAVTEVTQLTTAMQGVLDWINTNAEGLNLTGDTAANAIANGSIVTNRFTPAQTAGLRTELTAAIAEIA